MLADTLNEAGQGMRTVLSEEIEIDWTKEAVKEYLFKPIMKIMYGHTSTTQLSKSEVGEVWDTLLRHLTEKGYCDYVEFPSEH
jgi:hypothetical protein